MEVIKGDWLQYLHTKKSHYQQENMCGGVDEGQVMWITQGKSLLVFQMVLLSATAFIRPKVTAESATARYQVGYQKEVLSY